MRRVLSLGHVRGWIVLGVVRTCVGCHRDWLVERLVAGDERGVVVALRDSEHA